MATSQSNAIKNAALTMRATVYQRTANSGPFNNAVKTGLACRLDVLSALSPIRTSPERADISAHRTLMYDVDYALQQQGTQIEITNIPTYAGQRWNVVAGTDRPYILPGAIEPMAIEIDVRKAN
jgi:hypothetical protein